ncbi:MFS transporter [Melghirimyces algeriensis]|uniref:Predicted arabinose efflux permease, MFS family n=1 Tax=Melghirimyces algeriensis TaxID=910412 RepID=A0A521E2L8_9BACL|nr:MFS transporter [Melghirimyces algeriensis]SMO78217.1 Predicted arabinose efflux permease, MFS family [Melghirimyces algeriensis]
MKKVDKRENSFFYLYLLTAGKSISDIGNFLNMVAINMYAYFLTGSAWMMGLFMAVRLLGGFINGYFSGILADRFNRKTLMITADAIRSAALILLVVSPASWKVPLLFFVSFMIGAFSQLFNVALQSSIPTVVGPENRVRANAILTAWQSIAMVIGVVTAGVTLDILGYEVVFIIDAITYLLSALNLFWLPIRTKEGEESTPVSGVKAGFWHEAKEMFQYMRGLPLLLGLMFIRLIDTFGSASHNVGMPIFSAELDPDNPSLYMGLIWGVWAVGNLAGSKGMSRWFRGERERWSEIAFGISTFLMSGFFILLFWGESWYTLLPFALIAGLSDGVSSICFNSRLQQEPDRVRGRIFGVASTFHTIGFGVGMILCSPLFEWFSPLVVVGLMHGIPLVCSFLFSLHYVKRYRQEGSAVLEQEKTRTS